MKNMTSLTLGASLCGLVLFGTGCIQQTSDATSPTVMVPPNMKPLDQTKTGDGIQGIGNNVTSTTGIKPLEIEEDGKGASVYEAFSKERFQAAQASHEPIVLAFCRPRLSPCRTQDTQLRTFLPTFHGRVHVFQVNYDTERALRTQFNVRSIQTMIFLNKNAQEEKRAVGPLTNDQLTSNLRAIL